MLISQIVNQIRKDVASFADPGCEVQITERTLTWTRSRTVLSAQLLRRADGFPDIVYNDHEYSYLSFLASEALADLKDLAATLASTTALPPYFVTGSARLGVAEGEMEAAGDASELILRQVADRAVLPLAATRVLFVHGNAGSGKTSTLLHVTRLQAERYLRGETQTLLLYLDAQGKGLSQLEDVMARALQDLRAKFTYHSVAALTRRHCVIPIVDGFDELIGPSSAREAFANLAQFLAQLECEGAIIASSRSGFIDYRTLHERAAEVAASQNLSYEIVPVEVLEWEDQAIAGYCAERTPGSTSLRDQVFGLMSTSSEALLRKPFFLTKACEIFLDGRDINKETDITRQIVDAALIREASKLRDQSGRELLSPDQHRVFAQTLADEMWALGGPELDCETIRLLAELIAEQFGLSPRDTKTLVDRSIAHGLLMVAPGGHSERRAFEHELFRFEFQASSLARLLTEAADAARDYVLRAELPFEVVSRVPLFGFSDGPSVAHALVFLSRLATAAPNSPFGPANAGGLVASLVRGRQDLPTGLRLHGLYIRSQALTGCRLEGSDIRRSIFERVELTGSELRNCKIDDCQFVACVINAATRWDGTEIDITDFAGLLEKRADGRITETYDPARIRHLLKTLGATVPVEREDRPAAAPEFQAGVDLVQTLLTHARNHFYLVPGDRWFQNNLSSNETWPRVERLLRKHKLLEDVSLTKSGAHEIFLRLTVAPDKILQARGGDSKKAPPEAIAFWKDLAE